MGYTDESKLEVDPDFKKQVHQHKTRMPINQEEHDTDKQKCYTVKRLKFEQNPVITQLS